MVHPDAVSVVHLVPHLSPVLNLLPGGCDVMCRENGVRTLRTGQTAGIMINIQPPPPPLPPFSFTAISLRAAVLVLVGWLSYIK